MPHSLEKSNGMAPQVNGEAPSSAFLSHLTSYPVVSDSISTFKSNPYGAKSIDLTATGYEKFGKPIIPYLQKPYQYVSPYVARADELGDSTLSTLETKFPAVKKPTDQLINDGKSLVLYPIIIGNEGKEYVLSKYNGEIRKTQDQGLMGYGKAVVATGLIVSTAALNWLGTLLLHKKEETKEVTNEKLKV
ncbi:hypothetical protein ACMFMG_009901 [Clarireedia jacksonii]